MRSPKTTLAVILLMGVSVALVTSCGDDDKNSLCIGDETFIVALSLESVWVYRVTDYDTADVVIRTVNDTVMLTGTTVLEGNTWYETTIDDELWMNRADGFWIWPDHNDDVSQPYLLSKFPASLGQRYAIPYEDIAPDTMAVADMMALVTVPYGSFTAITYQRKSYDGTVVSLAYYVRGIGKVKEIMILDRETKQVRRIIELLRFSTTGC